MKKMLLSLAMFLLCSSFLNAQTIYYWVGGSGTAAAPITTWNTTWNLALDGSSTSRTTPTNTDILIFDGSQSTLTANSIFLGLVPADAMGQLKFINSVNVTIMSAAVSTALSGTSTTGAVYGVVVYPATGTGTNYTSELEVGDYVYTTGTTANNCQVLSTTSSTDATFAGGDPNALTGSALSLTKATTWYIKGNPGLNIAAGSTLNLGH
ncbi:MAG: hypothetical protein H7068_06450, partial [Pedobacter sp.]|nr:hypothetical protein [Chitinophagaceae bacterium]